MKALLLTLFLLAPTVNATSIISCSIVGSVTECAADAVKACGQTDTACLSIYGFVPKYQTTVDDKKVWCGLSTTESPAIVYGNCSGARG